MCPLTDGVVIGESYKKNTEIKLLIYLQVFAIFFLKLTSNIFVYDSLMMVRSKKKIKEEISSTSQRILLQFLVDLVLIKCICE